MDKKKLEFLAKLAFSIFIILGAYWYVRKYVPSPSRNQSIADMAAMLIQIVIIIYVLYKDTYNKTKYKYESIVIGALVGLSIAMVFIGVRTLNPTNIGWIMAERDRAQHFLGWNFFRNDTWHFPLGYFNNWANPEGMSIIFTDSIPLVAVILKFFRNFLPSVFQYLGIWIFMSFTLMGAFTALLFNKVTDNLTIKVLASIFFVANPLIFQRVGGHTALTSHWLLIWGIYLLINSKYEKKHIINWVVLILLSLSIHPYFLFMVYIIFLTYLVKGIWVDKILAVKKGVFLVGLTFILTIGVMYINGYFKVEAEMNAIGFGLAGFNLNSFFNPIGTSRYIKTLNALPFQYEAMAYLGLGGILGLIITVVDIIKNGFDNKDSKLRITLLIMCIVFVIAATSNRITYFEHNVVIPIGDLLTKLWSIVRCTGRLIWPVWYIIIFLIFVRIIRTMNNSSKAQVVLGFLVIVQLLDFSHSYMKNRESLINEKKWAATLTGEFWNEASKKYEHIAFVEQIPNYEEIAYFASVNDITLDYGYFAREPKQLVSKLKDNENKILNGNFEKDTLYVISYQDKLIEEISKGKYKDLIKHINGHTFFAP